MSFHSFAPVLIAINTMREKILESVTALFLRYGVRSVSMDDIARELGISKKTIYQHFKDKDELVFQITHAALVERQKEFEEIERGASNAIEEQVMISKCIRKDISQMNPSLMFDIEKYHPRAWEVYVDHEKNVIEESVKRNLRRGIEEGYFRSDINVEIIARLRLQQVRMSFSDRVFPGAEFDFKEVQLQLFDHFVHGLLTLEGIEMQRKYLQAS